MKLLILVLVASSVSLIAACQTVQPYNGKTGYQRESTSKNQLILSYTLDAKASDAITQQKLKKACAKELGLGLNVPVSINIIDKKEFATLNDRRTNPASGNTVQITNTQRASFGLSSTPKLSNTSNNANSDLLGSQPTTLKQITVECLR